MLKGRGVEMNDNRSRKILIFDDKDSWSCFAHDTLSAAGFTVVVDADIKSQHKDKLKMYLDGFDLIILDLIKTQHDSLSILSTTRASESKTPKLAVTSNPTITMATEAMKKGASSISPKPYTEDSLLAMVKENMKLKGVH